MSKAIVGIIGGSGVYDLPGLTDMREERVATPWGDASDSLRFGRIGDTQAVFLARHGRGHRFSPSSINYRANIDALKRVGVTDIIALSACGSVIGPKQGTGALNQPGGFARCSCRNAIRRGHKGQSWVGSMGLVMPRTKPEAHPSTSSPFDKLTLRQAQGEDYPKSSC